MMRFYLVCLVGIACAWLGSAKDKAVEPTTFADIDYVVSGYNVIKGNPLAHIVGGDPGFTLPVFNLSYNSKQITGDGRYLVPDNISVLPDRSCTIQFKASEYHNMASYSQDLSESASVSSCVYPFSASASYNHTKELMTSLSEKTISSMAKCSVYRATVMSPPLHPYFTTEMSKLENTAPPSTWGPYYDFLDRFGTHYLQYSLMGARYGFMSSFSSAGWKQVDGNSFGIQASAGFSSMSAAGQAMTSDQSVAAEQFNKLRSSYDVISVGANIPAGTNTSDMWVQQVLTDPVPIIYHLQPISDLIQNSAVKTNMVQALSQYCTDRIAVDQPWVSCTAPSAGCLWDEDCMSGQQCVAGVCQGKTAALDGDWNAIEFNCPQQQGGGPTGHSYTWSLQGTSGTFKCVGNDCPQCTDGVTCNVDAGIMYDGNSFMGKFQLLDSKGTVQITAFSSTEATAMFQYPEDNCYIHNLTKSGKVMLGDVFV